MSMTARDAGRVVVGVDGSEQGALALLWAVDEARHRGATLRIVHVREDADFGPDVVGFRASTSMFEDADDSAAAIVAEAAAVAAAAGLETVESILASGPAAASLLDAAHDADLLVVGSRGRTGFIGFMLGSVSQQCVLHARCPVVVVPAAATLGRVD